jgi:acetylornithine deacetylase/succinyl-diaminopimelate desuccinylase-like protein
MSAANLLARAHAASERSLALYLDLLRIPSVWGDAARLTEAAELLAGTLCGAGLDVRLEDSGTEEMPMVVARLRGRAGGRSLILAGHMEVYPPSESWQLDPWGAVVRDGRVYGQGAADMKGGTAAMTAAAELLGREGVELPGDLVLLAVPNHFEGGEGTRRAIRGGLRADRAIVCEPTGLGVATGQRGILYLTITVRGRAAHTSALGIGVNAIERAARVVEALRGLVPRDAAGRELDADPIVNVAMIDGGVVHNLVPERCGLTVDVRFPPEQTVEDVLRDVRALVSGALGDESEFPTSIEPEETCVRNPRSSLRLPDGHPLVQEVAAAHAAAAGRPAELVFHPAWPDTPIFNELGIPAVTYGPGSMDCYWDDESVPVADYLTAVTTYVLAAAGAARDSAPATFAGALESGPADS